jgi:signal transduction histidine kinase
VKIRNRIALSTSIIVAFTLTLASSLIFWNIWREDQGGNYESTPRTLFISLVLLVVGGTISSFFLGRFLSKRALNPVQDLINQVEQATENSRVHVANASDDIGKIAHSLNGLLDRLEASSANQKRFTADAGHELRGPLTTMQLSIDALRASHDSSELKDISTEIGRLAKLCNDLLDLSRVEGRKILMSDNQLVEIIQEQLRTFGSKLTPINVHLDESINQSVICNRQLFGLAIRNLLENAFQYAKSEVKISARRETDGLHIIIQDDGPGVPAADNEHIFERFYRSEKVRTIGKGGTGLGLSVVSSVMGAHRGKALSILGASGGEFHLVLM